MNIVVTGGTGFVGQRLTDQLVKEGHHVYVLTRSPDKHKDSDHVTFVGWLKDDHHPARELPNIQAVVNLAGESLNSGRWTEEKKREILDSRIQATEGVLDLIRTIRYQTRSAGERICCRFLRAIENKNFYRRNRETRERFSLKCCRRVGEACIQG